MQSILRSFSSIVPANAYTPLEHHPLEQSDLQDRDGISSQSYNSPDQPTRQQMKVQSHCLASRILLPAWTLLGFNARRLGYAVLPSFLHHSSGPPRLFPTSYLDGLRGIASLIVFLHHYVKAYHDHLARAYDGSDAANRYLLQFPILRLILAGNPMVSIFFVISGYVLSYKTLKLSRAMQWDDLLLNLSSTAFRRSIRLFIPPIISTFVIFLMLRMRMFESTRQISFDRIYLTGTHPHHPKYFDTTKAQFVDWVNQVRLMVNPWSWEEHGATGYDPHLWTIGVEFRSSMVLFVILLALSRIRPVLRAAMVVGIIAHCYHSERMDIFLFLNGMLLAEINLMQQSRQSRPSGNMLGSSAEKRWWKSPTNWSWSISYLVAGWVLSAPVMSHHRPGVCTDMQFFHWICAINPNPLFWSHIGSIWLIWTLSNARFLQDIYTTAAMQYLGKISYALYLVHGTVNHAVGYSIIPTLMNLIGKESIAHRETAFLLGSLIVIPVAIWAADIFHRTVDVPAVRFGKWMEKTCLAAL